MRHEEVFSFFVDDSEMPNFCGWLLVFPWRQTRINFFLISTWIQSWENNQLNKLWSENCLKILSFSSRTSCWETLCVSRRVYWLPQREPKFTRKTEKHKKTNLVIGRSNSTQRFINKNKKVLPCLLRYSILWWYIWRRQKLLFFLIILLLVIHVIQSKKENIKFSEIFEVMISLLRAFVFMVLIFVFCQSGQERAGKAHTMFDKMFPYSEWKCSKWKFKIFAFFFNSYYSDCRGKFEQMLGNIYTIFNSTSYVKT